jgi:hypothetical protein
MVLIDFMPITLISKAIINNAVNDDLELLKSHGN